MRYKISSIYWSWHPRMSNVLILGASTLMTATGSLCNLCQDLLKMYGSIPDLRRYGKKVYRKIFGVMVTSTAGQRAEWLKDVERTVSRYFTRE